jgi:hypothetical protein
MDIKIGFTDELTNTSYAPLAVLFALYQHNFLFQPLETVQIPMRKRDFEPHEKLIQVLLSIMAGCETLSEFNPKLKHEQVFAKILDKFSNSRKKRGKEVDGRFREDYDVGETTGKQNTGQTG